MHRGSSNGRGDGPPAPESLPLSASPSVTVTFRIARAGRTEERKARVAPGTTVRKALRAVDLFGEGCAVLAKDRPVPLDRAIDRDEELTVVPTFSGG